MTISRAHLRAERLQRNLLVPWGYSSYARGFTAFSLDSHDTDPDPDHTLPELAGSLSLISRSINGLCGTAVVTSDDLTSWLAPRSYEQCDINRSMSIIRPIEIAEHFSGLSPLNRKPHATVP